jgi:hypothetical protein
MIKTPQRSFALLQPPGMGACRTGRAKLAEAPAGRETRDEAKQVVDETRIWRR